MLATKSAHRGSRNIAPATQSTHRDLQSAHDPRSFRNRRSAQLPRRNAEKHGISESATPATKSVYRGSQNIAPATQSAHRKSQSAVPTTNSAHRDSQNAMPATNSTHRGLQNTIPITKFTHKNS